MSDLDQARRDWVALPQHPDAVIAEKTGHGWDAWVDRIEAGPGRDAGHTAIATWVREECGVDGWWAQAVTVGFERIAGLRLPGQMPDGTFSVSRSRIVDPSPRTLRAALLDDARRPAIVPELELRLRSKPASKSLRFACTRDGEAVGTVAFTFDPAPGTRTRATVTHEKLESFDDGVHWKSFWADWLDTVEVVITS